MAHFARVENGVVTLVLVVPDAQEHRGSEYLAQDLNLGGTWLKCSYNTRNGRHILGGTPLRGTFPMPGYTYNASLDRFEPPSPSS